MFGEKKKNEKNFGVLEAGTIKRAGMKKKNQKIVKRTRKILETNFRSRNLIKEKQASPYHS